MFCQFPQAIAQSSQYGLNLVSSRQVPPSYKLHIMVSTAALEMLMTETLPCSIFLCATRRFVFWPSVSLPSSNAVVVGYPLAGFAVSNKGWILGLATEREETAWIPSTSKRRRTDSLKNSVASRPSPKHEPIRISAGCLSAAEWAWGADKVTIETRGSR